jgi:RNA polymerase sigma-70 factor (ECF subfamily)
MGTLVGMYRSVPRREEFDRVAIVHLPELLRVARRVCGTRESADDLVQETYLQAWRSFGRFQSGTNCRAWLYRIMFCCRSRVERERARRPPTVELDARVEDALRFDPATPDTLTIQSVHAAFGRLPEPFRIVILLVDIEQLTYREAAEALDVPIGTIMSRLSRGRRLLRLELGSQAAAAGVLQPARTANERTGR